MPESVPLQKAAKRGLGGGEKKTLIVIPHSPFTNRHSAS